jgi:hypothetical protein
MCRGGWKVDYKCVDCASLTGFRHGFPPVAYFGDINAPIALFSINPSLNEFAAQGSKPAPFEPWDIHCRTDADEFLIDRHKERQDRYFQTRHYYKKWFDPVEKFLQQINTLQWGALSFGINNARANVVHLDVVKCATTKIWRNIKDQAVKDTYIENCSKHLLPQIMLPNLRVILLNGKTVRDTLYPVLKKQFYFVEEMECVEKLHLWTKREEEELRHVMTSNRTQLKDYAQRVGRTVDACKRRWKDVQVEGIQAPEVVNTQFRLYRYLMTDRHKQRKWLIVGTSQRISPDDQGMFRNSHDRGLAASKITRWIDEFSI